MQANEEAPETPPEHLHDDRHLARRIIILFFVILVIVASGIATALFLREGPVDYFVQPADREQRLLIIERANTQMRETTGDDTDARLRRDIARVAIAIQQFAIDNDGRLPRTLMEAGIDPGDIEPGVRYSYGSRYWRLFQENNRLLARGN